jgi:hypothetical protein
MMYKVNFFKKCIVSNYLISISYGLRAEGISNGI